MSIPASITTALASLQAQATAAAPLINASVATRTAIKLNAANLVAAIQSALTATSLLDTFVAPTDPGLLIAGIQNVIIAAEDESALAFMRGYVGRATSNLDQLP
jgi:hypothetical protein